MKISAREYSLISVLTMLMAGIGCGGDDGPAISDTKGFYSGESTSKFQSAIFDVKNVAPGRRVTYVFIGYDSRLCEKILNDSKQGSIDGPMLASAWTGDCTNDFDYQYGSDKTRALALSTGIPNIYKYVSVFKAEKKSIVIRSSKGKGDALFVDEISERSVRGQAMFGGNDEDTGSLAYRGRRCPGLAKIGERWFTEL